MCRTMAFKGCYSGFRAIVLPAFGVLVMSRKNLGAGSGAAVLEF